MPSVPNQRPARIGIVARVSQTQQFHAFQQPYNATDLAWHIVEYADDETTAIARYTPKNAAIYERMNAAFGVHGWSLAPQLAGANELLMVLTMSNVSRSVFVTRGAGESAEAFHARSVQLVASEFGLPVALTELPLVPVEIDPESGEAIELPEPPHVHATAASVQSEQYAAVAEPAPETDELAAGRELIGRLIDRLQQAGQGHEAAKLVARSSGYGANPAEARALYGQLRDLLQRSTSNE